MSSDQDVLKRVLKRKILRVYEAIHILSADKQLWPLVEYLKRRDPDEYVTLAPDDETIVIAPTMYGVKRALDDYKQTEAVND